MTTTKKIIYTLGALVLLFLIAGILMPKKLTVNQEICTDIPAPYLHNILNDLSMYPHWNVTRLTMLADSLYPLHPLKGEQAVWEFPVENDNAGRVSIVQSSRESITYHTDLHKKTEKSVFRITQSDTQNCLTAEVEFYKGFPTNVLAFIAAIGHRKQVKKSLNQLLHIAEKRYRERIYRGHQINESSLNQTFYVIHRAEVKMENARQYFTQNISVLYQSLLDAGINAAGMPCALFFKWDEKAQTTDMAAALPVLSEVYVKDTGSYKISPRKALVIDFYGDISNIASAHYAMDDYMADRALLKDVPVIEEYVTDSAKEADVNKWLTRIIYLPAE